MQPCALRSPAASGHEQLLPHLGRAHSGTVQRARLFGRLARPFAARRLAHAVAERDAVETETASDGTVTYRFGGSHLEGAAHLTASSSSSSSSSNGSRRANGKAAKAASAASAPEPPAPELHHPAAGAPEVSHAAMVAAAAAAAVPQLRAGGGPGSPAGPGHHTQLHLHLPPLSDVDLDALAVAALQGEAAEVEEGQGVPDPQSVDYSTAQSGSLLRMYLALCGAGELDGALHLIRECIRANRTEVLMKLRHHKFLRPAKRAKAVKQALRFIQLMPRQYVDSRTYNMVVSVCAEAGDLRNALHAADMLQMAGLKLDTLLYTNLIKACAAAGNAERAFQLYSDMRAGGVQLDRQVYCALVNACAEQIERTPMDDRRGQLVLLERAMGVVADMKKARVPADAAVWNALVGAAGRAGQLQRAFNVVEEMMVSNAKPNSRTYAQLIDACARSGDKELALRVYRRALREGCGTALQVFAAAVNACAADPRGSDVEAAMQVYRDLQRSDVAPDSAFYGVLMLVAGKGGQLQLALDLQQEMEAEGLQPCSGTTSALIAVHIHHDQLPEAAQLYRSLRSRSSWPHHHAMNALVNAYANHHRLGDVVSLVAEMVEGGMKPDAYTFAAILNACLKADECELAVDVYRLMKQRGVRPDDTHARLMLWMCCLRLKQEAAGVMPGPRRVQERAKLLQALQPRGRSGRVDVAREPADVAWLSQAFAVYRDAVGGGNKKPSLSLLNLVLTALQVPWQSAREQQPQQHQMREGLGALTQVFRPPTSPASGEAPAVRRQGKIGVELVFHVQAISIMEEAIVSGIVPSFAADTSLPVDLRELPPVVAAAYACMVVSSLQRQVDAARQPPQSALVFLVPPFDPRVVFRPSGQGVAQQGQQGAGGERGEAQEAAEGEGEAQQGAQAKQAQQQQQGGKRRGESEADLEEWLASASDSDSDGGLFAEYSALVGAGAGDTRTGLAVAGALRRMRLYTREFGQRGLILVEAREFGRWSKLQARLADSRSAGVLPVQKPYGQPQSRLLADQQRNIRW